MNINEFDSFIYVYFGPNYTDFEPGHDIEPKIEAWLSWSGDSNRYALLADIELLLSESSDLEADFAKRYKGAFVPELWGTTATAFLALVREKVSGALAIP